MRGDVAPIAVEPALAVLRDQLEARDEASRFEFETLFRLGAHPGKVTVATAARFLGITGDALASRLARRGLPAPKVPLRWGAVAMAMHGYAHQGLSLRQAARRYGFAEVSGLSRRMFEDSGLRPSTWRDAGADLSELVAAFVRVWRGRGR